MPDRIFRHVRCPHCQTDYVCNRYGLKVNPVITCRCGKKYRCDPDSLKSSVVPDEDGGVEDSVVYL